MVSDELENSNNKNFLFMLQGRNVSSQRHRLASGEKAQQKDRQR
jgi:hypothetical protein